MAVKQSESTWGWGYPLTTNLYPLHPYVQTICQRGSYSDSTKLMDYTIRMDWRIRLHPRVHLPPRDKFTPTAAIATHAHNITRLEEQCIWGRAYPLEANPPDRSITRAPDSTAVQHHIRYNPLDKMSSFNRIVTGFIKLTNTIVSMSGPSLIMITGHMVMEHR